MKPQSAAAAMAMLAMLVTGGLRAEERPKVRPSHPVDRAMVEALIRQLHSPSRSPRWTRHPQVEDAKSRLRALGTAAFPILIEHVNDPEYSGESPPSNLPLGSEFDPGESVGDVCRDIIKDQIDLGLYYPPRTGADGKLHDCPGYFWRCCRSQDDLRKWWQARATKSLREMQIEALQWTIAREREVGFSSQKDEECLLKRLEAELKELTGAP